MLLGHFNNVLKFKENCFGADVAPYELRDIEDCCFCLGLSDMLSIGYFFTWTNSTVWTKLDRAMVNNMWVKFGLFYQVNFLALGCLSDHSHCILSLCHQDRGM